VRTELGIEIAVAKQLTYKGDTLTRLLLTNDIELVRHDFLYKP